jgi:O-antigen/teichoic acid export membrane protein
VPFGLLALSGPWLFSVVFGREWAETGRYFQVLAPMCLTQLVVVPLSQTLAILERQSLQLGWDAARLALLVGVFAGSRHAGLAPYPAIALFGIAMTAAYIVLYLLMLSGIARGEVAWKGERVEEAPQV